MLRMNSCVAGMQRCLWETDQEGKMAQYTDKSLRQQVIYQIFTRNYRGGKLKDVERDLDRIKSLGVDIIYLLPVQPSGVLHRKGSMGSPYAISDYRAVDPEIGTMQDFAELTEAAHRKGLKVMLDVVYNHTSPDSVLAKSHPEWFFHKADGSLGNRIGAWWDVVDLDYESSEALWNYQIETLKMWAKYVDGFRCDVAPMVPLAFWKRARREVEQVRPGCIWLAEAVEPEMVIANRKAGIPTSSDSELYQAFDICYDYDTYNWQKAAQTGCMFLPGGAVRVPGERAGFLKEYLNRVNLQEGILPENYVKLRCLENHDRPRAAELVPDERALRNWTAWQYFEKGTAMVYAGQEFEVTHHPTLFDRDPVDFETGRDLAPLMRRLRAIRQQDLFADSSFEAEEVAGEVIFAVRERRGDAAAMPDADRNRIAGLFSTLGSAKAVQVDLPDGTYTDLISGRKVDVFEHAIRLTGEPVIFYC